MRVPWQYLSWGYFVIKHPLVFAEAETRCKDSLLGCGWWSNSLTWRLLYKQTQTRDGFGRDLNIADVLTDLVTGTFSKLQPMAGARLNLGLHPLPGRKWLRARTLQLWLNGTVEQWSSVATLLVLNLYRNTAGLHGKHVFGFVNSSCLYQWDFNPNYWHHKWVKTAGILQFWITQVDGGLEQGHKAHMPCLPFLRWLQGGRNFCWLGLQEGVGEIQSDDWEHYDKVVTLLKFLASIGGSMWQ